jgi:rhodanese-related sulfurtransferase
MTKTILTLLFAVALILAQQAAPHAKVLTRAEMDALLAKPGDILLIDVRQPDEISKNGGFPVYLNIQMNALQTSLSWIPRDRRVIAVSNHAHRGAEAADILSRAGFKVAGAVGAQSYEQEGGKLTKIAPRPPNPEGKKQ